MEFNFNFGENKTTIFQYAIIGIILTTAVGTLSRCTKIPEDKIYRIVDKIQRKIGPNSKLNDYIIHDKHLLDIRVRGDVGDAISDYERKTGDYGIVKLPPPNYSEKPIDSSVCYTKECQSLGGEMRLCSPWILDCPKENTVK